MKNVLLIANAYPPENIVGALRPSRFARYLPEFGYRPVVITASVQLDPAPKDVYYAPRPKGLMGYLTRRFLFPCDDDMLWPYPAYAVAEELWPREKPDVLFSTCPPMSTHWLARRLKRKFGVPWVADFRDPFVGDHRTWIFNRATDPWFERHVMRDADRVVLNTDQSLGLYEQRYPEYKRKLELIYNGYDPNDGLGPKPQPPRSRRQWIHAGSIYYATDVERLLMALEQLIRNERIEAPVVRLIGEFPISMLEQLAVFPFFRDRGLIECVSTGLPRAQALQELGQSDATMVFDVHFGEKPHYTMSSKVLEAVRVGRPLLAFTSPSGRMATVVAQSGIPHAVIFHDESIDQVAAKLVSFSKLPAVSTAPSEWFARTFDCIPQTQRLAAIFDEIQR